MSFGLFMSPFDDFSPVWGHECHSPWTYSPRFCSVHGKLLSPFGTTSGFRGGHRRKARARQNTQFEAPMSRRVDSERQKMTPCEPDEQPSENKERFEETTQSEAPMSCKVDSERENTTPCEPEEQPSGNKETYEEKGLESEMEKETVKSREESCATASQGTLDRPANNVNTFATQNAEEKFKLAVEPDTHVPEVEKKLEVIEIQLTKAREFVPRLQAFSGIVKERLYLEEHLTRCILELDKVEANGSDVVKSNRKAAIREIESLLGDLDRKC